MRSNHIREELSKIDHAKQEVELLRQKYEEESKNIHTKYQEIIEQANQEAVVIKSKIIDEAYQEGDKIKLAAEEKAKIEIDKLFAELKMDIVDIATEIAEKLLREKIDTTKQDQLMNQLLEEAISGSETKTGVQNE